MYYFYGSVFLICYEGIYGSNLRHAISISRESWNTDTVALPTWQHALNRFFHLEAPGLKDLENLNLLWIYTRSESKIDLKITLSLSSPLLVLHHTRLKQSLLRHAGGHSTNLTEHWRRLCEATTQKHQTLQR